MPVELGGRPYLSVVVPAYNEEARIGSSLERITEYLRASSIHAEILVVDDGSTDETRRIALSVLEKGKGRVVSLAENRGKGHAVRRGVIEARGRWILMTDADLSTPIEEHDRLAREARDHDLDIVIGSRALPESRVEVHQHPAREMMGKSFNVIMRGMTGLSFRDTQCGFKLMDRKRTGPLFERMVVDRFAFDVELLFLSVRFGLSVREIPVVWRDSPGSRVSVVTDPFNMLWDVIRVRWRFRRGLYNPDAEPSSENSGA